MTALASSSSIPASRALPSDRNTNAPFFMDKLPLPLEEHTKKLFVEYSKIPEDRLEQHLNDARKRAWECCPYPCIGRWLFLRLQLRNNTEFDEAVQRTQKGQKLLDFGCAVGQDLRSLAYAGAPQNMLYGVDLQEPFFEAGAFLFRDPDNQITFRQADALDPNTLQDWHRQFSIVTCNYVFHLMSIEDQETLTSVILKLLSGGPDDLVFGRTAGTELEARSEVFGDGLVLYRHSPKSFEELWTRVAAGFGRKAVVESWIDPVPLYQYTGEQYETVRNLMFAVRFA